MNEKYIPYYKWKKLSAAEKDEFNYKFKAKLDDAKNDTKNIDIVFMLSLIFIAIAMLVTIQGAIFLQMPPTILKYFAIMGLGYLFILGLGTSIKEMYYKYKINKWLKSKDL